MLGSGFLPRFSEEANLFRHFIAAGQALLAKGRGAE
jgi:hypothetical protein